MRSRALLAVAAAAATALLVVGPGGGANADEACVYTAADGAQCSAAAVGGTTYADTAAELDCTSDEVAKYCQKGDFIFKWVCTPVVCNIVYDYGNSSLAYYFDPACRKCVSCLVDRCPTVPVMGDSDYCYADVEDADCEGEAVDCGEHGTLCSCFQCDCDAGWATDWASPGAGYCTLAVDGGNGSSNPLGPAADGGSGLSTTTIWIIVSAVAAAVVVAALVTCCVCIFRKRQSTVKLQEMMEEFQSNALDRQRGEMERRDRRGVHARPMEEEAEGGPASTASSVAGAGAAAAAGGASGLGGGWLLQYCNEYKEPDAAPPPARAGGGGSVPLDPVTAPPEFRRQSTLTMSSNSPTASLFATSPGAALPPASAAAHANTTNKLTSVQGTVPRAGPRPQPHVVHVPAHAGAGAAPALAPTPAPAGTAATTAPLHIDTSALQRVPSAGGQEIAPPALARQSSAPLRSQKSSALKPPPPPPGGGTAVAVKRDMSL